VPAVALYSEVLVMTRIQPIRPSLSQVDHDVVDKLCLAGILLCVVAAAFLYPLDLEAAKKTVTCLSIVLLAILAVNNVIFLSRS
jgi:hypothetical protein